MERTVSAGLGKLGFRRDHETIIDHGRVVYLVLDANQRADGRASLVNA
jgi:hypothetical protein